MAFIPGASFASSSSTKSATTSICKQRCFNTSSLRMSSSPRMQPDEPVAPPGRERP
eukprot:CAMPEP_0184691508 /NCGR_PEP_ID=MMETSP0313-20130426/346_1 /TAXON_ID=2792 /ORGANISM="Porphyridium aerugineum, Strain SAG 1380-2" /LENGTH=55 /DNA_ID=CAMNT_0027149241 /DNA_START=27 /DNA_END=190 /DNA_ORIENTATION=+